KNISSFNWASSHECLICLLRDILRCVEVNFTINDVTHEKERNASFGKRWRLMCPIGNSITNSFQGSYIPSPRIRRRITKHLIKQCKQNLLCLLISLSSQLSQLVCLSQDSNNATLFGE